MTQTAQHLECPRAIFFCLTKIMLIWRVGVAAGPNGSAPGFNFNAGLRIRPELIRIRPDEAHSYFLKIYVKVNIIVTLVNNFGQYYCKKSSNKRESR